MIAEQLNTVTSSNPLLESAWTILEAANDLRDVATVQTCRRGAMATELTKNKGKHKKSLLWE
jgi:hypothetical protein